jgi:hypothetical protein
MNNYGQTIASIYRHHDMRFSEKKKRKIRKEE